MKAAVYHQTGAPEVLVYEDVPDPDLTPDGVRVAVEAVSIEGGDTLNRRPACQELSRCPRKKVCS